MKTVSLKYLDCCYPDYFQGFGGQTYAVTVESKTRTSEVLKGLHSEIDSMELWIDGQSGSEAHYEQLHASAEALFADADKRKTFCKGAGDECYAYFGVVVESDE